MGVITLENPGAQSTVSASFQASGRVNPPNSQVTAAMIKSGNTFNAASVDVPNNGTWTATFQNVPIGGGYICKACIKNTATCAQNGGITVS